MDSFYSESELKQLGLKSYGKNVKISRFARIYSPESIEIGDNVRIDDFCILSGCICLGSYIHISPYSGLFAGDAGIEVKDFASISSQCILYSISDDFSGNSLFSPLVPDEFRGVKKQKIIIEEYGLIGTGTTLLPGAHINVGTAVGAKSLIYNKTESWKIYAGIPAKIINDRSMKMLEYAAEIKNKIF